jgi:1-deoxy-D-xylulose-5-phosphate reductoisomerase
MAQGGLSGAAFNAAKEVALDGFIAGRIGFVQMAEVVEETLTRLWSEPGRIDAPFALDNVLSLDAYARDAAGQVITERAA